MRTECSFALVALMCRYAGANAQSMPWINPDVLSTTAGTDVMSTVLADRGPGVDQTYPADPLSASERPPSGRAGSVSYSYRSSPSRTRQ